MVVTIWIFARFIAPVVTITSIILSSSAPVKLANPGLPGRMAVRRERKIYAYHALQKDDIYEWLNYCMDYEVDSVNSRGRFKNNLPGRKADVRNM